MIKTRKFKRALAVIMAFALMACMAQTTVFAENQVNAYDGSFSNNTITVKGSINKSGADMTMLAVRTTNQNIELADYETTEDLAAVVQYIDQITATSDSDNYEYTWTFELREPKEDSTEEYVVVFVSGTDANLVKCVIPLVSYAVNNGTVAIAEYEEGKDAFVGSLPSPLLILEGEDAWKDQLDVKVYNEDETEVAGADINAQAGTVSFTAPDEKTTYIVKVNNTDTENCPPFTEKVFTFDYISEDGAKLAALPSNLGVIVDKETDPENKYSFVIPDDTEDVTYTATIDGVPAEGKTFDVEKAEEGGEDKVVVVTAKVGDLTKTYTVTVPAKGKPDTVINADNVTIASRNNVYNKTGCKLIKVVADIDPAAATLKVGETDLYYSPDKEAFYGVVDTNEFEGEFDAAAIANAAVKVDEPASILYFCKAANPSKERNKGKATAVDVANAKKIVAKSSTLGIDSYIAADVSAEEPDGQVTAVDVANIKKNVASGLLPKVLQ